MKIRCLKCNDIIEFLYKHDYRKCKCGLTSIDGGKVYTRIGGDLEKIILNNPKYIKTRKRCNKLEDELRLFIGNDGYKKFERFMDEYFAL